MKKSGKILLIDDDKDVLFTARTLLKNEYAKVVTLDNPQGLADLVQNEDFDIIVLDMNFTPGKVSGEEGLDLLKKIFTIKPDSYVVMSTAYGDIDLAVESMKAGAIDFIIKPWQKDRLLTTLRNVSELRCARKEVDILQLKQKILNRDLDRDFTDIVTVSPVMENIFSTIRKVAATDASVMILGENGTGKELIAREIHRKSHRADHDFVSIDMGALTYTLFESELFGHEKGAFTDAKDQRIGRFEMAAGGTIFLDEIGNISRDLQSKLLSVLQNREITRVGSNKSIPVDFRLICATNSPIFELTIKNEFREDLLYRINTVVISLPPLRERTEDIPLLADHFLKMYLKKYNRKTVALNKEAQTSLRNYKWPGNIRELQHAIERAVVLSDGSSIKPEDFSLQLSNSPTAASSASIKELEKDAIARSILNCDGNLSKVAAELGLGRSTLYRKMKKYGLDQI
jgi:two-component system, NtrC family, response regulator HydG